MENKSGSISNDEWTLADHLNHAGHVREVARMVEACQPPYVLGIHGDWGTGKTSFLHKLHLCLAGKNSGYPKAEEIAGKLWGTDYKPRPHIETIWFDAWRYQFESNPVVALLNEIRAHFTWCKKLVGESAKLSYAALMSIEEVTKKIGLQPAKIVGAAEKWEQDHLYQPLPSKLCKDLLEEAIKTLLGRKKEKRLVIFVDDLDRCEGSVAFRLLEAMKIYLSIPNCVFVIGLDVRQINKAVASELKKSGMIPEEGQPSPELYASDYLSKMFQSVYYLPTPADLRGFLSHLLDEKAFQNKAQWIDTIVKYNCLPHNPRKIKKFSAGLGLYLRQLNHRLKSGQGKLDHHLALVFIYLKLMANNIYRILEVNHDFWQPLKTYCEDVNKIEHNILNNYIVPARANEEGGSLDTEFPDPANEGLLHIARLIKEYREGRRPTEDEFKLYLLQTP